MGDLLRVKRGQKAQLPNLMSGEIGYCLDEKRPYIGGLDGNDMLPSMSDVPVNVRHFGAVGNGIANDTQAFLDAVASMPNGGNLLIPNGTYLLTSCIILPSNIRVSGEINTVIKSDTIIFANFDVMGQALAPNKNIEICGITFKAITLTFYEFTHLLFFAYMDNLSIHDCNFIGWKGDGICVATFGSAIYHNKNIFVYNNLFDGVNKTNRQGLSIGDCDNLHVYNNYFFRTTQANMPGAIDIEPDHATSIVMNVYINDNYLEDIGGNVGAISVMLTHSQEAMTTPAKNIHILDNTLVSCAYGITLIQANEVILSETTEPINAVIRGNHLKTISAYYFNIQNVKGVKIAENTFEDCANFAQLGFTASPIKDITLSSNTFKRCGATVGTGLAIFGADRLKFIGNTFDDCGTGLAGASNVIDFVNGTSSYVSFINNDFITPTLKSLIAIQKEAGHTYTPLTNIFQFNNTGALSYTFALV